MDTDIDIVKDKEIKYKIIERCGLDPISDGIQCPYCGIYEAFKDRNDPNNIDKWWFIIRAFKVDTHSECRNCGNWFGL